MSETTAKQLRRALVQLDEARDSLELKDKEIITMTGKLEELEKEIWRLGEHLKDERLKFVRDVHDEQVRRIDAQRQLINDIRTPCFSCGQAWRPPHLREIGYDPDQDLSLSVISPHRT